MQQSNILGIYSHLEEDREVIHYESTFHSLTGHPHEGNVGS